MVDKFSDFPEYFEDKLITIEIASNLDNQTYAAIEKQARILSSARRKELQNNPIQGNFDLEHLAAIHKHLFQDVSSFAGMVRNFGMMGHGTVFARPENIEKIFDIDVKAMKKQMLDCDSYEQFSIVSANMFNNINFAHPFREGNGRSSRIFMEQLANVFGLSYRLDNLSVHDKKNWYSACESGFKGDMRPLTQFFNDQIMGKEAAETLNLFASNLKKQNIPEENFKYIYNEIKEKLRNMPDEMVLSFKNKLLGTSKEKSTSKNTDLEP